MMQELRKLERFEMNLGDEETILDAKLVHEPSELVERNGQLIHARITRAQKTLRIQQVVTWMLDAVPRKELEKRIMEKWKICSRQAKRYIAEATDQVEAMSAAEVRGATTLALYRLTELYHEAISEKDFKTALDIIKVQNRMLGLNAPEKIEARAVENWDTMSIAEQLDHVAGILARANEANRVTN